MIRELQAIGIVLNEEQNRFELPVGGHTAHLDFVNRGNDSIELLAITLPEPLANPNVLTALIEKTLRILAKQDTAVSVQCPQVKDYLEKNPTWTEKVKILTS